MADIQALALSQDLSDCSQEQLTIIKSAWESIRETAQKDVDKCDEVLKEISGHLDVTG